jgi:Forkhead domain
MSNEDDECDSSSLFTVASQSDVNSFLRAQAAKITGATTGISDDDDSSMDGSLLARFTQIPLEKKLTVANTNRRSAAIKPYSSRSCFASLSSSSPSKISSQKVYASDDLTELKWLNTFKLKELKEDINGNDSKDKDINEKSACQPQETTSNDEDRLAKLISELKSYDHENTKTNTNSLGILIFLALYSQRDEKHLSWSLTIKQFYEYAQLHAKQITNKRGWKNSLRQALIAIPCFVKTKRDLLKSRSLWTIDPYYRPLLTKAYLSIPPATLLTISNKYDNNDNNKNHEN